jgi:hypothetical protein
MPQPRDADAGHTVRVPKHRMTYQRVHLFRGEHVNQQHNQKICQRNEQNAVLQGSEQQRIRKQSPRQPTRLHNRKEINFERGNARFTTIRWCETKTLCRKTPADARISGRCDRLVRNARHWVPAVVC